MKSASNIDLLKICCVKNDELPEIFALDVFQVLKSEGIAYFDGFEVVSTAIDTIEEEYTIHANIIVYGKLYATMTKSSNTQYSFIRLENSSFYQITATIDGEKKNSIGYLPYIIDAMGLRFHNITTLDVCLDMNVAAISRIRKAIKDVNNLDLFINGKKVKPEEKLNILYIYGGSRMKLDKKPSIYISSATDELSFKVYDKDKELTEKASSMQEKSRYTRDWCGIAGKPFQRIEVRIKKEKVRELCKTIEISEKDFLLHLDEDRFRRGLLEVMLDKIIFFKDRKLSAQKKGGRITLLDIVETT